MIVKGFEVSEEQLEAGRSAMTGRFRIGDIKRALILAGVSPHDWIAEGAADRLLQKERKAGRVRAVNNKLWEAIA